MVFGHVQKPMAEYRAKVAQLRHIHVGLLRLPSLQSMAGKGGEAARLLDVSNEGRPRPPVCRPRPDILVTD